MIASTVLEKNTTAFKTLEKEGFYIFRGILNEKQLRFFQCHLKVLDALGAFYLDKQQVLNRKIIHNEPQFKKLHYQLVEKINEGLGIKRKVKPSYAFLAQYLPGQILKEHRDREQCAYNLSVVFDQKPANPIVPFFITHKGTEYKLDLSPGDAVLYQGTKTKHRRDAIPQGVVLTVCVFHFVPERFTGSLI